MLTLCINPIARAENEVKNTAKVPILNTYDLETTEYSNIYLTTSDDYVMKCDDDSFIIVGRLDIDLLNDAEYQQALQNTDIPSEVKEALSKKRELAINNDQPSTVSFFSPDLANNSNIAKNNSKEIYHTYNGHQMKSVQLVTKGCSSGYHTVADGKGAYRIAKSIVNIVISFYNGSSKAIPIIGKGISIYDIFMDAVGSSAVINGNTGDLIQVCIEYDITDQWTYGKIGTTWTLGLMTHNAEISKIDTYQHYYDSNAAQFQNKHIYQYNISVVSPHFNDPWETAWKAAGYVENEIVSLSMYDKTWRF